MRAFCFDLTLTPAELAVSRSQGHQAMDVWDTVPANQIALRDNSQTRTRRYHASSALGAAQVTASAAESVRQQPWDDFLGQMRPE